MSWVDAQAKYDLGSRLIKLGLDMMQEYLEMVKDEEKEKENMQSMQEAVPEE